MSNADLVAVLCSVALILVAAGAVLTLVRLVRGPSTADRAVSADQLLTLLVVGVGIDAVRSGTTSYLVVIVVVGAVGFVGTATVARYIQRRGART